MTVVKDQPIPLVDLRVDWSDQPVADLRALWARYAPEMDAYLLRALDPEAAPVYGTPGNQRAPECA